MFVINYYLDHIYFTKQQFCQNALLLLLNTEYTLQIVYNVFLLKMPSLSPSVSVFKEDVASQTGVGMQYQRLMYLGHDLPLEGNMKVVNLPSTSCSQPLILLCYAPGVNIGLPFRERKMNRDKELYCEH